MSDDSEMIRVWISITARVRPRLSESSERLLERRGRGLEGKMIVYGGGGSPSFFGANELNVLEGEGGLMGQRRDCRLKNNRRGAQNITNSYAKIYRKDILPSIFYFTMPKK